MGISQPYFIRHQKDILSLNLYYEYISKTLKKAKDISADFISYAERAFAINEEDRENFIKHIADTIKYYKINILISLDIRYKMKEI